MTKLAMMTFLLWAACANSSKNQNDPAFAFVLRDAWDWNIIDTFEGTFTNYYSSEHEITIDLSFTSEELDTIKAQMQHIKILDYPTDFRPPSGDTGRPYYVIEPHPQYDLKVKMNDVVKEIHWNDVNYSTVPRAQQLRALIATIQNIVQQKPEYKKLPKWNYLRP